ncbi:class F sortase [Streptomyces pristinaespiralis]|uniref:Peptidase C60 n=1 Tax=Streptomyces pristinaespiralis TaxID=38300 RepID=A0A0M4DYT1_STRPR|nr:class F sortase [Streptomyces pristinaespiralis]ALC25100.1 peptidase C60 [Streptomyces pristinaespiralis]QMU12642.1 class F sortase [Streptomyces pristinaespiralis]
MSPPPSKRGPWCTLLCVLLFGVFLVGNGTGGPYGGPPQPSAAGASAASPGPAESRTAPESAVSAASTARNGSTALPPAPDPLPRSTPRRVSVPEAGIEAPLTPVGLDRNGWVSVPSAARADVAGWYSGAATPGERGTSVVVGHVDDAAGPAVFYPLGSLTRGTRVEVLRDDRRTAVFAVYAVEVFDLRDFPAEQVYADTAEAEIRLITCGGTYSRDRGYEGNVVVFGRLVAVR